MKIVYAFYDDWSAIYIDGKLYNQDHSLGIDDLIEILEGKPLEKLEYKYVDSEWFEEEVPTEYPDKLEDVKFEDD